MRKYLIIAAAIGLTAVMLIVALLTDCSGTPKTLDGTRWIVDSAADDITSQPSGQWETVEFVFDDSKVTRVFDNYSVTDIGTYTYSDGVLTIDYVDGHQSVTAVKDNTLEIDAREAHLILKRK